MNASVLMWRDIHAEVPSSGAEVVERGSATSAANIASSSRVWDAAAFAENQIAALVRRVFLRMALSCETGRFYCGRLRSRYFIHLFQSGNYGR